MIAVVPQAAARRFPVIKSRRRAIGGRLIRLCVRKGNFTERAANRRARERVAGALADDLVEVVSTLQRGIDFEAIAQSIAAGGDIAVVEEAIGLGRLQGNMTARVLDRMAGAISEGAEIGLRFSAPALEGVSPLLVNEAAAGWIEQHSIALIDGLNERTQAGIRRALLDQLTDQVSPTRAAARIGDMVGLTEQQSATLNRFRQQLERQLIPVAEAETVLVRETIEARVKARSQQLLRQRGATIAETEMQAAIQHGERTFWHVASDEGAVDLEQVIKTFFTVDDGDVCEECMPLHGVEVKESEPFESPEGWIGDGPPVHPRCRCYLEYAISGALRQAA